MKITEEEVDVVIATILVLRDQVAEKFGLGELYDRISEAHDAVADVAGALAAFRAD